MTPQGRAAYFTPPVLVAPGEFLFIPPVCPDAELCCPAGVDPVAFGRRLISHTHTLQVHL